MPDTVPFGTPYDLEVAVCNFALHAMAPKSVDDRGGRLVIGNPPCRGLWNASRLDVSARMTESRVSPGAKPGHAESCAEIEPPLATGIVGPTADSQPSSLIANWRAPNCSAAAATTSAARQ